MPGRIYVAAFDYMPNQAPPYYGQPLQHSDVKHLSNSDDQRKAKKKVGKTAPATSAPTSPKNYQMNNVTNTTGYTEYSRYSNGQRTHCTTRWGHKFPQEPRHNGPIIEMVEEEEETTSATYRYGNVLVEEISADTPFSESAHSPVIDRDQDHVRQRTTATTEQEEVKSEPKKEQAHQNPVIVKVEQGKSENIDMQEKERKRQELLARYAPKQDEKIKKVMPSTFNSRLYNTRIIS